MARSLLFTNRKSQMCDCLTNDGIHRCRCDNRVNIHTIVIFLRVNPKIAVMRLSRDWAKNSEKKRNEKEKKNGNTFQDYFIEAREVGRRNIHSRTQVVPVRFPWVIRAPVQELTEAGKVPTTGRVGKNYYAKSSCSSFLPWWTIKTSSVEFTNSFGGFALAEALVHLAWQT